MNIAITGKTGILTSELQRLDSTIISLSSNEYDISKFSIIKMLDEINFDTLIHAGAITNSSLIKDAPLNAIQTNIIGTAYLSQYCLLNNKRLVYISTDYVYPGDTGNYHESDPILPHNEYAWSKLGGECSVKLVPNHLIIRTSFGADNYPYEYAWDNLITSKDYVDIITPKIYKASLSNLTGILNIGTEPKSIHNYATRRSVVDKSQLEHSKNFSLNLEKYEQIFTN